MDRELLLSISGKQTSSSYYIILSNQGFCFNYSASLHLFSTPKRIIEFKKRKNVWTRKQNYHLSQYSKFIPFELMP